MSVEFRQRTPSEYGRILWKRKWLILLPAIAIFFAVAMVVWRLPDVYQSSSLLTVRPASVSSDIIGKQLSDDDLTLRINNISLQVLSRSNLQPLIETYDLYHAERQRGEPLDLLIERMRKQDITIELNKSRNDITNGFNISFKGPRADVVQHVTSDLAGKYIAEQTTAAVNESAVNKQLIDEQVKLAKDAVDAIDHRRLEFMTGNIQNLPDQQNSLAAQLTGLHEAQKAYIAEVGRLRDQLAAYTQTLGDLQKQAEQEKSQIAETTTDPKTTLAWSDLSRRESELEANLQGLLTTLKPKNPDVVIVQQQLDSVKRHKQEMIDEWKARITEKQARLDKLIDPRQNSIKTNIELVKGEMARQENLLNQTNSQIAQIEQNLSRVPGAEVTLQSIDNDYKAAKAKYDDLVMRQSKIDLAGAVNAHAQGETIQVIDPASMPEKPIAPKRPLLIGLGLGLGLVAGLIFAAAFEVPHLLTIQSVADARHYTGLPVLVTVPELFTPREQRRIRTRRMLLAAAGIIATIISIPALALLLKLTHVFERFSA